MSQLTEKQEDAIKAFITSLTEGDRVSVHWFDVSTPGGRVWLGTVLSIAADKKLCRIKYDAYTAPLVFPPTDAKIHDMKRVESVGYGDALLMSEGAVGHAGTLKLDLYDVATHGIYLNTKPGMTVEEKAEKLVNYESYLRRNWDMSASDSRTSPDHDSNHKYRLNDVILSLVAWGTYAQKKGPEWRTDPNFLHLGDCIMATAAAIFVDIKKKSVLALAQGLDAPGKGLRGRIKECVTKALGKKPGEGVTESH